MNCRPEDMLLYAVTDRAWLNGETLESQVEKALKGGATFVQLREKELDEEMFLEEAKKIKKLCAEYHVPFVINDNVDIALKIDADGVHVGQSDMEAGKVREKLGPDKIIGVSCKNVEQALLAKKARGRLPRRRSDVSDRNKKGRHSGDTGGAFCDLSGGGYPGSRHRRDQ